MRVLDGDQLDSRGKKRSLYWSVNDEPSMTVQSDAHLADIENILRSYGASGMEQLDETALEFRDISEFTDYHDLMLNVREAEVRFMELPSKVREIFDHSVEKWLDTAFDEDKRDALVEAGFLEPPKLDKVEPEDVPRSTQPEAPRTSSVEPEEGGPEGSE